MHPIDKKDLLEVMLNGRDKETGEGLSEENIAYNVRFLPSSIFVLSVFMLILPFPALMLT
jgi:hypothetical protein